MRFFNLSDGVGRGVYVRSCRGWLGVFRGGIEAAGVAVRVGGWEAASGWPPAGMWVSRIRPTGMWAYRIRPAALMRSAASWCTLRALRERHGLGSRCTPSSLGVPVLLQRSGADETGRGPGKPLGPVANAKSGCPGLARVSRTRSGPVANTKSGCPGLVCGLVAG